MNDADKMFAAAAELGRVIADLRDAKRRTAKDAATRAGKPGMPTPGLVRGCPVL